MLLKIKRKLLSSCFFISSFVTAQIQVGVSIGNNFDFGQSVLQTHQTNTFVNLSIAYQNYSNFKPSAQIIFSKLPLNFSEQVIANQRTLKTVILNNSKSVNLGIETAIKKFNKFNFSGRLGIGITFIDNPLLWVENSNQGIGFNTQYTIDTKTLFSFLDTSFKIDSSLSKNWSVFFQIGTNYYPSENSITITSNIFGNTTELSSTFTIFRPYFDAGFQYSFN